jgi:hypothetical protein
MTDHCAKCGEVWPCSEFRRTDRSPLLSAEHVISNDDGETLERMIDRHDLVYVVTLLECIASEKAAHIRENWQDNLTARRWDADAKKLNAVARTLVN